MIQKRTLLFIVALIFMGSMLIIGSYETKELDLPVEASDKEPARSKITPLEIPDERQESRSSLPLLPPPALPGHQESSIATPQTSKQPRFPDGTSLFKNSEKSLDTIDSSSFDSQSRVIVDTIQAAKETSAQDTNARLEDSQAIAQDTDALFSNDDLDYLEKKGAEVERNQRLNPGYRTGGGSGSTIRDPVLLLNDEEVSDEEEPLDPITLYEGQARGYTLLTLMQASARAAVEAQLDTLMRSEVESVYIGVLTDGTFGKDFEYLQAVLRRFHEADRKIVLGIFLTNGPTMRRYDGTPITAGFNRIEPGRFRDLIRFDPDVRARFVQMAEEVRPTITQLREWSSRHSVVLSVMLEDNLRIDSYTAMRQLAQSVFGETVSYVRNPCPNCYSGNDVATNGDAIEHHRPEQIPGLGRGDGFSLDGVGIRYGTESDADALTIEEIQILLDQCLQQGVSYIGLWRKQRQGIYDRNLSHPDQRSYEVMTTVQQDQEVQLLRHGLTPVERTPESDS